MAVIGIDLGGTKISGAVFDREGNKLQQANILLAGKKGAEVGALITQTIGELLQKSNDTTIDGIGICVPGISDTKTGKVWCPNIPGWESYPLQKEIEDFVGATLAVAPVARATARVAPTTIKIAGDRSCYILGETWKGVAQGAQNAVFIAVGTGIGMGILANGQVIDGSAGISGAIGWMALDTKFEDDFVQYGCFESNASGNGIARQAQRLLRENTFENSLLKNYPIESITAHEVFDAWSKNDAFATQIINRAVQFWGMASANIVSLLNPEVIIWGGGVFGPGAQLLDRIYEEACRWAQPIAIKQVRFEQSQLGGDAGLIGAGKLVIV
jgi:glucokinase